MTQHVASAFAQCSALRSTASSYVPAAVIAAAAARNSLSGWAICNVPLDHTPRRRGFPFGTLQRSPSTRELDPRNRCLSGRPEVRGIDRPVAASTRQRSEQGEQDPLHGSRWTEELALAAELPGEQCQRQELRNAARIRPAVVRQPIEILDHQLEPLRGTDLDQHVRLVGPDVPPVVDYARRHLDRLAWSCDLLM